MRHLAIAIEGFVLLVLSEELLQILLVRHAGRLVLRHILDPVCPRPLVSHPCQAESRSATRAQRYPRPHCRAMRPHTLGRRSTPRSGLGVRRNLPQDAHSRARARLALLTVPRRESRPHTGSGSAGGLMSLASRMVAGAGSGLVPSAPGAAAGPIVADMLRGRQILSGLHLKSWIRCLKNSGGTGAKRDGEPGRAGHETAENQAQRPRVCLKV